jgi:hypothetical protein
MSAFKARQPPGVTVSSTLLRKLSLLMFRRLLATVRESRHGGSLLFLPSDKVPEIVGKDLKVRVKLSDPSAFNWHKELLLKVAAHLVAEAARDVDKEVSWEDYLSCETSVAIEFENALMEEAALLASLVCVDGAVIMTDHLDLIGFGAEIICHDVQPETVYKAVGAHGQLLEEISVQSFGTRHRSVFRFARKYPESFAIVASQDGDSRFVVCQKDRVVYYEHQL